MPKKSIQEFAASYKAAYPQFSRADDHELVSNLVRDYPDLRDEVDLTPTSTWGDSLITGGLRIGGSIAGGALGSLAAPVAGTIAGGAAGAAVGEGLAEAY